MARRVCSVVACLTIVLTFLSFIPPAASVEAAPSNPNADLKASARFGGDWGHSGERALGFVPADPARLAALKDPAALRALRAVRPPAAIDWSEGGAFPPPGDQGRLGSCTAWATGYAYKTYQENLDRKWGVGDAATQFSPAYIYDQIHLATGPLDDEYGDGGGAYLPDAFDLVADTNYYGDNDDGAGGTLWAAGCDTLDSYPYSGAPWDYSTTGPSTPAPEQVARAYAFRAVDWNVIDSWNPQNAYTVSPQLLKEALAYGPEVVGLLVYWEAGWLGGDISYGAIDWSDIDDGWLGSDGGHAVCLVGYDDEYVVDTGKLDSHGNPITETGAFKFINSWASDWGQEGYGWMSYDYAAWAVEEAFTMADLRETLDVYPTELYFWPGDGSEPLTATASTAWGETSDVSATATWSSTDPDVVTVDSAGLVTPVGCGTATITCDYDFYRKTVPVMVPGETPYLVVTDPGTGTSLTLDWSAVEGAADYDIYQSSDPASSYGWLAATSGTTLSVGSLDQDTAYWFKVVPIGADGSASSYDSACAMGTPRLASAPTGLQPQVGFNHLLASDASVRQGVWDPIAGWATVGSGGSGITSVKVAIYSPTRDQYWAGLSGWRDSSSGPYLFDATFGAVGGALARTTWSLTWGGSLLPPPEGYYSIEVQAGNTAGTGYLAAQAYLDDTDPTLSFITAPAAGEVIDTTRPEIVVQAFDPDDPDGWPGSGLVSVAVTWCRDDGSEDYGIIQEVYAKDGETVGGDGSDEFAIDWGTAALPGDGEYYLELVAGDYANNFVLLDTATFMVDVSAPDAHIDLGVTPAPGEFGTLPAINDPEELAEIGGYAYDGAGVTEVDILVKGPEGYWNPELYGGGGDWQDAEVWFPVDSLTPSAIFDGYDWSVLTDGWLNSASYDGIYLVRAKAIDLAGNETITPDKALFILDTSPPEVWPLPSDGASVGTHDWTVGAETGDAYGVRFVRLTISDATTDLYWDGSAWVPWMGSPIYVELDRTPPFVDGSAIVDYIGFPPTTLWFYYLSDFPAALPTGYGTYEMTVEAEDYAGNATSVTGHFDVAPSPDVSITVPAEGALAASNQPYVLASATSSYDTVAYLGFYCAPVGPGPEYEPLDDWTIVQAGAVGPDWVADWSGSGVALADGTYAIWAQACDSHSIFGSSETVHFTVDATGPVTTFTSPVDGDELATPPALVAGTCTDPVGVYGGSADVHVAVKNPNGDWWDPTDFWRMSATPVWSEVAEVTHDATSFSWQGEFPPPAACSPGFWQVLVEANDTLGNRSVTTISFLYDPDIAAKPSAVIDFPSGGGYVGTAGFIYGRAFDDFATGTDGVTAVDLTITGPDGQYWNGSAWQTDPATVAAGTSMVGAYGIPGTYWTWSYPTDGWLVANGTYNVTAKALDGEGLVDPTPPTIMFTCDTVAPVIADRTPANWAYINGGDQPEFGIQPSDPGSGIDYVSFAWWDNNTYTGDPAYPFWHNLMPSGPDNDGWYWVDWAATYGYLPDGCVQLWARATDKAGNGTSTAFYVIVDNEPPAVEIGFPSVFNQGLSSLTDITGTASDSAILDKVSVALQRASDGALWTGGEWSNTAVWDDCFLPAALSNETFDPTSDNRLSADWAWTAPALDDGTYFFNVRAYDSNTYTVVGNEFTLGRFPAVTITAPSATVVNTRQPAFEATLGDGGAPGSWGSEGRVSFYWAPADSPDSFTLISTTSLADLTGEQTAAAVWGSTELPDGDYILAAQAWNSFGTSSQLVEVTVHADPPALTLDTPADGAYTDSLGSIVGTVSDENLSSLGLYITDETDPANIEYWGDSGWQSTECAVAVTSIDGSGNWDYPTSAWLHDGYFGLVAEATDAAGNSTSTGDSVGVVHFIYDTTAPTVPANLQVTAAGQTQLDLSWDASTDDSAGYGASVGAAGGDFGILCVAVPGVAGYSVYGSDTETGLFTKLNDTLLTGTTFSEIGLSGGQTRWYYVTATDGLGYESGPSDKASGTTQTGGGGVPAGPTNVYTGTFDTGTGGAVEGPDFVLEAPPDTVLGDDAGRMTVTVTTHDSAEVAEALAGAAVPEGFTALPIGFEFKAEVQGATGGSETVSAFEAPFILRLELTPEQLAGVSDPEKVGLFRVNADGTLTFVGGRLETDSAGRTFLVAEMWSFSTYVVGAVSPTFEDLVLADGSAHWAKTDIELMASKFVVRGMGGGLFVPSGPVTRAQFACMLVRAMGLPVRPAAEPLGLSDVKSSDWFYAELVTAVGAGLIDGFDDGTFRPNDPVTREQVAVMVTRALTKLGKAAPLTAEQTYGVLSGFGDGSLVSLWAQPGLALAVSEGIVTGSGGLLTPQDGASRAEATVMIARFWRIE